MTLGEIVERLEAEPEKRRLIPLGFCAPHSYRGYYKCLAFRPKEKMTIEEMISALKSADGSTFEGYKGGNYTMDKETECYLSFWSEVGIPISTRLLEILLGEF